MKIRVKELKKIIRETAGEGSAGINSEALEAVNHVKEWTGRKFSVEEMKDIIWAFSNSEDLFDLVSNSRKSYRREHEEANRY